MALLDLVGWTATISTYGMFLVGITICRTIYRKGTTGDISAAPFIMCALGCFYWLMYGLLKSEYTIINVNVVGLGFELIYLMFFYMYARDRKALNLQIFLAASFGALGLGHNIFSGFPHDSLIDHMGIICMVLNVLTFAWPLVTMKELLKRQNTESLSFALCIANLFVSGLWLKYGIMIDDIYMKVPNALGFVLTVVQLALFAMYPSRHLSSS